MTPIDSSTGEKRRASRSIRLGGRLVAGGRMAGQAGAMCAPSGATALVASAISYALGACVQVAPGEMTLPTPCADWDLAALLAHLAASMADLEAAIRTGHLELDRDEPGHPAAPALDDDPVEVLRDQAANLLFACYAHHGRDRFV